MRLKGQSLGVREEEIVSTLDLCGPLELLISSWNSIMRVGNSAKVFPAPVNVYVSVELLCS